MHRIRHWLLCWQIYPVNKECKRWTPCCWCTYLLNKVIVARWYRHKCTHVGTRFEYRSMMCTTPVVRRCSRSIRCRNCPIRWGSRRKWFDLVCFEMFLPSNLGTLHCCWNQHMGSFYRPHSCCIRLDWLIPQPTNIDLVGIQCRQCWKRRRCEPSTILLGTLLCFQKKELKEKVKQKENETK